MGDPVKQKNQSADTYRQITRELGSAIGAYGVSPLLLTLSLYESRLNRKYQSLLKQLRLTQKLRHAEALESDETAEPPSEAVELQPLPSETQDPPSRVEDEVAGSAIETETRPAANQAPHPPAANQAPHPPADAPDEVARTAGAGPPSQIPGASETLPRRGQREPARGSRSSDKHGTLVFVPGAEGGA